MRVTNRVRPVTRELFKAQLLRLPSEARTDLARVSIDSLENQPVAASPRRSIAGFAVSAWFFCGIVALTAAGCSPANDATSVAEVHLEPVARLEGVGDSVDLSSMLPAISAGGYIAARREYPPSGLVALFDPSGTYLKSVGTPGRGPGEFEQMSRLGFGPGDSLIVVDNLISAHLFSPPPAAQYVRTIRFQRPMAPGVTSAGLLTEVQLTPAGADPPRRFSWDGSELARYGPEGTGERRDYRMGPVAFVDSTAVWSAYRTEYRIDLLGSGGSIEKVVTREVEWFPRDTTPAGLPWVERPRPRITAVSMGPDGMLWVVIWRAHREWARLAGTDAARQGPVLPHQLGMVPPMHLLFESVLEVLDPESGRLIAALEMPARIAGFVAPGIVCEIIESENGLVALQLWRVWVDR